MIPSSAPPYWNFCRKRSIGRRIMLGAAWPELHENAHYLLLHYLGYFDYRAFCCRRNQPVSQEEDAVGRTKVVGRALLGSKAEPLRWHRPNIGLHNFKRQWNHTPTSLQRKLGQ